MLGIFEASVSASLLLLGAGERFGIVSTGKVWEGLLTDGVRAFMGGKEGETARWESERFAGVQTTGLDADELHSAPESEVRARVKAATARLVRSGISRGEGQGGGGGVRRGDGDGEGEGEGDARNEEVGMKEARNEMEMRKEERGKEARRERKGGRFAAICLGCAGMVGMEKWVREAVEEIVGEGADDTEVRIVDGVKVGMGMLVALVRGGLGGEVC